MANTPPVQVCSLAPKCVNLCARPDALLVYFNSTDAHDQINTQFELTFDYISLSSGSWCVSMLCFAMRLSFYQ
jgi:hypothetical protein